MLVKVMFFLIGVPLTFYYFCAIAYALLTWGNRKAKHRKSRSPFAKK